MYKNNKFLINVIQSFNIMTIKTTLLFFSLLFFHSLQANTFTIQAEAMTRAGQYTGLISNPFAGVAYYANNDRSSISIEFPSGSGHYEVSIRGASNNQSTAGISLYINSVRVRAYTFTGTTPVIRISKEKLQLTSNTAVVELRLETDNGQNDTFIDYISFTYEGPIVVRNPPVLPAQGAFYTGQYRNMLAEAGYTETQISQRLSLLWNRMFYGNAETEAVYYPVGTDEAYILDTGNNDIRSEGMSYGMMIAVQMDKKEEFDKLWKWSKTRMQFQTGVRKGYFSWQITTNGLTRSDHTAPDGDIYFAMALMFASGRWGDGEGIYNYWKEANYILENSMSKSFFINSSYTNLFNEREKQIVFVPYASSANHTDPSYHVPSFFHLWALWADNLRWFWMDVANKSREMFPVFAHPTTGLMPDYANFNGTPTGGNHADFRFDAWRNIKNMAMDYAWFKESETQPLLVNRIHNFFASKGIESYKNQYSLSGAELSGGDHSPGLVACNAAGALASNQAIAWEFIDDFMNITLTSGTYRYYDGLLYFLSYLHLSGNFRIYKPAHVREMAVDESYVYENGYLIMENFENLATDTELFMRRTETSNGKALVAANPMQATEKSLQIRPGNYDEFFALRYKLPNGRTLGQDYSQLEFDVFYPTTANNQRQDLKVDINTIASTPFYKQTTGEKTNHGRWDKVVVPLNNVNTENVFNLYIGIRTNDANFFIDNLKLKTKYIINSSNDKPDNAYKTVLQKNNQLQLTDNAKNVRIYNASGAMVYNNTGVRNIDINHLSSGVYYLVVNMKDAEFGHKFIKN